MKQPMTQNEIKEWSWIASLLVPLNLEMPEYAYEQATRAIAARRAALIADANVGRSFSDGTWWCVCLSDKDSMYRFKCHDMDVVYCEACHTRRPDEVKP